MRRLAALIALGLAVCPIARAGQGSSSSAGRIRVLPIRGNVYLLAGAGANVTVSVGRDGVLLVDSGGPGLTDALLGTLQELSRRVTASPMPLRSCIGVARGCDWWTSSEYLPTTAAPPPPRPIIGIINTGGDVDHVSGNAAIAAAGRSYGVRNLSGAMSAAWVLAHENVTRRLMGANQATLIPTETFFGREKKLNYLNGEPVVVTHHPAAHSDGDAIVHFRGSDVLVAGDILDMTGYPVIDVEHGGSIQGLVDALNWMLDVAVVEHMMEGGTMIVAGHGRLTDAADVAYYRDMVTIIRDRVGVMRDRGLTLDQIRAARLTRDYDRRFGRNPAWPPDRFVEAIYRTLPPKT